jgi:hypothetical protein
VDLRLEFSSDWQPDRKKAVASTPARKEILLKKDFMVGLVSLSFCLSGLLSQTLQGSLPAHLRRSLREDCGCFASDRLCQ